MAASQAPTVSRCERSRRIRRPGDDVSRQRWRGSGTGRARAAGSTSGSLRHDERARPDPDRPPVGHAAHRLGGGTPAAPVHPAPRPRTAAARSRRSRRASCVLIGAGVVLGLLLWMARDAVRPFIVGLLFVYLLDPLVRRLAGDGAAPEPGDPLVYVGRVRRRSSAFLCVTVGPLIDEIAAVRRRTSRPSPSS